MPIQAPLAAAIFLTTWWIVLFTVLPLGVRSADEAGEKSVVGSDPGAPAAPMLFKKLGLTTAITAFLFLAFLLVLKATG